jgi:hypothetical protein
MMMISRLAVYVGVVDRRRREGEEERGEEKWTMNIPALAFTHTPFPSFPPFLFLSPLTYFDRWWDSSSLVKVVLAAWTPGRPCSLRGSRIR